VHWIVSEADGGCGNAIQSVRAANPGKVVIVGPEYGWANIAEKRHRVEPLFLTVSFVGTDDLILHAGGGRRGNGGHASGAAILFDGNEDCAMSAKPWQVFPGEQPGFVSLEGFGGRHGSMVEA